MVKKERLLHIIMPYRNRWENYRRKKMQASRDPLAASQRGMCLRNYRPTQKRSMNRKIKAKAKESALRRNSRPKRVSPRNAFCPVSRIPSGESAERAESTRSQRRAPWLKLYNYLFFQRNKIAPKHPAQKRRTLTNETYCIGR